MRTTNSIKNIVAGISMQFVIILLNFVSRGIFIKTLGANYLGIDGLFTSILAMLNLAELGIGSVIIYSLYRPLEEKDTYQIAALMRFYKMAYRMIGVLVLVIGFVITPFLHVFIKEKPDISHINIIYLLFVLDTFFSYFFSYKRPIIEADQKSYILSVVRIAQQFISNLTTISILLITKNYILYLLSRICIRVLENLVIIYIANKKYPYIKSIDRATKLGQKDKKLLFKNIRAIFLHKIGSYFVFSTDNLIISSLIGVISVGIYSNYTLIINAIKGLTSQVFLGITASFGNLVVTESSGKKYEIFRIMMFINFWISGFSSVCLFILLNPFIILWIGKDYVFEQKIVGIIIFNFYIMNMRASINIPKQTSGLFVNDKYAPLIESAVNLIVSIILVKQVGIIGVFIGTTISTLSVPFFTVPYLSYKYVFEKPLYKYYLEYICYAGATLTAVIFIQYIMKFVFVDITFVGFIGKIIVCVVVSNVIFILFFFRTEQFRYLVDRFKYLIIERINKPSILEKLFRK
ncbi:lipopolysaccharide biosynthesis protein [Crassaminicella indica]|uniref:Membrane protein involved in the export of O-antigen and teichoic acid n=1 Tax=Crassaminicella indica TaxID=2855394 RepID=A0ABX8REH5_9CLOT|nr:oligosaccharide flippase family protein [Crassaminicella indica]QXM06682.1 hypothetical protein KVH43_02880 [Crassaminicella indica]